MLKYTKFFDLLKERGIKQIDLREQGVHPGFFNANQGTLWNTSLTKKAPRADRPRRYAIYHNPQKACVTD